MQQPSAEIEIPQFISLGTLALKLARACTSWQAPGSGEDVFTYFGRSPRRTGDEHGLRASLIRERVLPAFHYLPAQIEYESRERFDLTLWSMNQEQRRRIAIIETKSSAARNLVSIRQGRETPTEQLERYLTQAGLYLGVLTNGDEWHLFDFAVANEPLASFSFIELAQLLQSTTTAEEAEQHLRDHPALQQALAINFYYLNAQRWEQTDIFRQYLANQDYHRIASLQKAESVEILVQQIKRVLGSLRDTIHAQFAIFQKRYTEYQQKCQQTSARDTRPFTETLQTAIEGIMQFGTALRLDADGALHENILHVLKELIEQYFTNGDISVFESEYLRQVSEVLAQQQLGQASFFEKKPTHSVHLSPPTAGLDELMSLLQMHHMHLQMLDKEYALSKKAVEAYLTWKAGVRGVFSKPEDEFCLQTAYIHFVRLFFVRVCEDHNLIPRRISDGPFARYEAYRTELLSGIKDTYQRLLEETYQRARSVYHNFFGQQNLFDWFLLDEYTLLALFDLLNRYDFQGLSADVLGRVYNEGYIETKERSERGQFYTPPQVVDYMLDRLGIPDRNESDEMLARRFLEKTVGDLSCGSGTFLVAAAARKSFLLQKLVASHEVDPDYALQLLTTTFLGFDLNPFACYLAEINLLIQCLPFLVDERGLLYRSVERFHIYCTDTLEPTAAEQAHALFSGKATERLSFRPPRPRGHVLSEEERNIISVKGAKGLPPEVTNFDTGQRRGIDYLIGNPPYVSAGESIDNLRYRNEVGTYGIYHFLHQRWDLFVPFFERNLQFLRPETGRLALIVSNGIETEGYAERLRQTLIQQYTLLEINFFPRQRLFQDAAVENTIVLLENHAPEEQHTVIRRKHSQADCTRFESLPLVPQRDADGQVFRWRYDPLLNTLLEEGTLPLCAIVYIGTGLEAQSKETFDTTVNGKREKLFILDDVFLPPSKGTTRPPEYIDDGVLGNDVDRYYLRRTRYVAYEKYLPHMRRRRHVALFRTAEKLLLGETSGGYYDREGLFANHSVQIAVPWNALEAGGAIEEKGIKTVFHESQRLAKIPESLAPIAARFDLRYLLGIINSRFMRQYIAANMHEGTREGRVYLDIWKRLPIKVTSNERQQQIAVLVDDIQARYRQLAALPSQASLLVDHTISYRDIQGYLARGELRFVGNPETTIGEKIVLRGTQLFLRQQPAAYLESSAPEILRYLEQYLAQAHELRGWSWIRARSRIEMPATREALSTIMQTVQHRAETEQQIRTTIASLMEDIELQVEEIYREPADSELLKSIAARRSHNHTKDLF